ncbi:zinc finger protein 208-like [Argiope bruennichi]|uniref:zinc finger protein 208-like n=1 Tax=Argiope bruennichi TaxID=94029 RepID=UPI002493F3F0|nr:zinc finger protein 208-like [Argiope bruennichi]
MIALKTVMGSTTSENEVNEHLPCDKPKVYPCNDCGKGYEFTKLALLAHKRKCSHRESCICFVCSYNRPVHKRMPEFLPIIFQNLNFISNISNKRAKLFENRVTIQTGNSAIDSEIKHVKQSSADVSVALKGSETKGPEGKSESSDSWENSQSDDSQLNQNKKLLYVKPVSVVGSKNKLSKGKLSEISDSFENNHDGEPCNRKIYCIICDKHIFWESFGTHVLQHSIKIENSHLICPQCNQTFRSPNLYLMHFPSHLDDHDCLDCHCDHPKCFKRSAVPSAEHSYAGEGICYICLKNFNGSPSVLSHLKQHCKECPFTCDECSRSFRQTGNLQRHLLAHRGEKPHKCPQCGTGFSDPATLRNHVRTHTKETPFVCKVCKRGFSQVGNLKRHMALHVEKEKDASVLILNGGLNEKSIGVVEEEIGPEDEKSSGSDLFSDHEVRKAGDVLIYAESQGRTKKRGRNGQFKLHVCKLCGKKYAWRHDLNIHFRTHTGEKPYKCELCDKQFAQSGAVRMHKVRHHNKNKFNSKKLTRLKVTLPMQSQTTVAVTSPTTVAVTPPMQSPTTVAVTPPIST